MKVELQSGLTNKLINDLGSHPGYNYQKVFIRHVLTHTEYDKEEWKNDAWYR
jgi:mRNA-degrading endonuclease HigB of HigAB toxin-antitoxin module